MAGSKKHMERSHRSVSQKRNDDIFNYFARRAYAAECKKAQERALNQSLGQTISQTFKKIFKRTKAC